MVKYQPLDRAITTGTGGWPEKRQRSHPSVMSLGRDGTPGRTAKVKPGPAPPPPQGPGGRFRGTCEPGPEGNDA